MSHNYQPAYDLKPTTLSEKYARASRMGEPGSSYQPTEFDATCEKTLVGVLCPCCGDFKRIGKDG